MKFRLKLIFIVIAALLFRSAAIAQLPIEVFTGDKKATLDIMFFKFFKNKENKNSKFLFFNRNRASIDYQMTESTNLPQFGFTEAISYNDEKLNGFAPVVVVNIFNKGVYPKAGIQFVKIKKEITIFSWVVTETLKNPNIDFFFLGRYTPKLSDNLNLYTQLELVNAFPTFSENNFSLTQRLRLGIKIKELQFGLGIDFNQTGRSNLNSTNNFGTFIRYEF